MLINLAFIKTVNGLFYFAMDYVAELKDVTSVILVRSPSLATAVGHRFPNVPVRIVGGLEAARAVWAASRHGEMVFTPSSHPIPWSSRQLVVIHDSFPFEGPVGALKAALFFLSMGTSHAKAGYINISDARAFLVGGGLDDMRMLSSPNRMATPNRRPKRGAMVVGAPVVVGLFGTDSTKKNYEQLFSRLIASYTHANLQFKLYGQWNDYIADVIAAFPELDIELTDSAHVDLEAFALSVDIVASAATREGFSRPIALSLSLGIPCWVVDSPVFREFYDGVARFYGSVDALAQGLAGLIPGDAKARPTFVLPAELEESFKHCVAWLKAEDQYCP